MSIISKKHRSDKQMKTSKIQIVAAISINGKIADAKGDFPKKSSKEDKEFLAKRIEESDVLVIGRKTYEKHVKKLKKPLIVFSKKIKGLKTEEKSGVHISWFNDSAQEFLNLLNLLQYKVVTVLGGAEIYHWFVEKKLASDIFLTVEPFIIDKGLNFLEGKMLACKKSWKLKSVKKINEKGSVILHYQNL